LGERVLEDFLKMEVLTQVDLLLFFLISLWVTVQRTKLDKPPSESDQFLLQSVMLSKQEEETFTPDMVCDLALF